MSNLHRPAGSNFDYHMRDFDARTVRSFARGDASFTMADTCMMPWPGQSD